MGSKLINKNVSYNFLIADGASASSTSSLDGLNGVVEFEDIGSSVTGRVGPCVMIKVVDRSAKCEFCTS